jgi:hypothetical protein
MQSSVPTRRLTPQRAALSLLTASLFLCTTLPAQQSELPDRMPPEVISNQPPNRPTTPPAATPQPQPISTETSSPTRSQPHRAVITYSQGQLTITADDSSLNEILRDISRQIGMTITGGVADERVFGHYGPSAPGAVLATLLDGTRSNMLFIREQNGHPSQLILTARNGDPTPPNPNAAREEEEQRPEASFYPRPDQSQPVPPPNPTPPAGAAAPPAAPGATTDQQSPNAVKTPQQIYDQLLKMRQPQNNTQPPAATPPQ